MAIDTREKRQAVVGINFIAGPSPTPNSSKDKEWRQEVGYGYPGIAAANPTPATGFPILNLYYRTLLAGK